MAVCKPGSGPTPAQPAPGHLGLRLPASRTAGNTWLLFWPPCLCCFVTAAQRRRQRLSAKRGDGSMEGRGVGAPRGHARHPPEMVPSRDFASPQDRRSRASSMLAGAKSWPPDLQLTPLCLHHWHTRPSPKAAVSTSHQLCPHPRHPITGSYAGRLAAPLPPRSLLEHSPEWAARVGSVILSSIP